jgi:hypothetical protein
MSRTTRREQTRHRKAQSHTLSRTWNKKLKNRRVKIDRRVGKALSQEG